MSIDFDNKAVALIGNSAKLLDSGYGSEIDSFPWIIRLNRGYTHQLDGDPISPTGIGLRTTHWACSLKDNFAKAAQHFDDVPCIYVNTKLYNRNPYHPPGVILVNAEKDRLFRQSFLHDRPSTGMLTIAFLMEQCWGIESLTLFGFDFFATHSWPNRFDDRQPPIVPHSGMSEQEYIANNYPSITVRTL